MWFYESVLQLTGDTQKPWKTAGGPYSTLETVDLKKTRKWIENTSLDLNEKMLTISLFLQTLTRMLLCVRWHIPTVAVTYKKVVAWY